MYCSSIARVRDIFQSLIKEKMWYFKFSNFNISNISCQLSVELIADCSTCEVKVTLIGANASFINKQILKKKSTATLKESDVLEVLKGKYPHHVQFSQKLKDVNDHSSCSGNFDSFYYQDVNRHLLNVYYNLENIVKHFFCVCCEI